MKDLQQEIEEILADYVEAGIIEPYFDEVDTDIATKQILALITEAITTELLNWFDLPKHYKGEEYRNQPFAKLKAKSPDKIQYFTLDSHFTWAILNRLEELKEGKI